MHNFSASFNKFLMSCQVYLLLLCVSVKTWLPNSLSLAECWCQFIGKKRKKNLTGLEELCDSLVPVNGLQAEKARTEIRGRGEILNGCLSGLQCDVIKTINNPDTCSTAVFHSHKHYCYFFPIGFNLSKRNLSLSGLLLIAVDGLLGRKIVYINRSNETLKLE